MQALLPLIPPFKKLRQQFRSPAKGGKGRTKGGSTFTAFMVTGDAIDITLVIPYVCLL